jgi:hypothetical protein
VRPSVLTLGVSGEEKVAISAEAEYGISEVIREGP